MPDFRDYALEVPKTGTVEYENTKILGIFMRDIMRDNPHQLPPDGAR
jgi:xylulose-5-phosphate/fructose-6-phosphate phosphoketolase